MSNNRLSELVEIIKSDEYQEEMLNMRNLSLHKRNANRDTIVEWLGADDNDENREFIAKIYDFFDEHLVEFIDNNNYFYLIGDDDFQEIVDILSNNEMRVTEIQYNFKSRSGLDKQLKTQLGFINVLFNQDISEEDLSKADSLATDAIITDREYLREYEFTFSDTIDCKKNELEYKVKKTNLK